VETYHVPQYATESTENTFFDLSLNLNEHDMQTCLAIS